MREASSENSSNGELPSDEMDVSSTEGEDMSVEPTVSEQWRYSISY
jgi:hypothetical protein